MSLSIIFSLNHLCRVIGSYLLHLSALSLSCRAGDFDGDGVLLSLAPQGHAVGLQRAEGDLQLRPREAARPSVFRGDLRRIENRWEASGGLRHTHTHTHTHRHAQTDRQRSGVASWSPEWGVSLCDV